jgi:hypothetical protein
MLPLRTSLLRALTSFEPQRGTRERIRLRDRSRGQCTDLKRVASVGRLALRDPQMYNICYTHAKESSTVR